MTAPALKVWQRMIVTPLLAPEPRWSKKDGLPWCSSMCPHLSLDVCGLTGNEAESVCIPAAEAMARLLNEDET